MAQGVRTEASFHLKSLSHYDTFGLPRLAGVNGANCGSTAPISFPFRIHVHFFSNCMHIDYTCNVLVTML